MYIPDLKLFGCHYLQALTVGLRFRTKELRFIAQSFMH
jgi:hypothetical protein